MYGYGFGRRARQGAPIAVVGYQPGVGAVMAPMAAMALPQGMSPGGPQQVVLAHQPVPAQAPDWMAGRQAGGVWDRDEDLVPLGLKPDANGGVFVAGGPSTINFIGAVTKPFQGERPFATVVPTGTSVAGVRAFGLIFVGNDVQMGQIAPIDLGVFVPTSFGARMKMTPAEPGIALQISVSLSVYPTGTDSVLVSLVVFGKQFQ